jgi:hypothetical protein
VVETTGDSGTTYTPAPGSLRLWTKDGSQARNKADIAAGGDYVVPLKPYTLADLGLDSGNRVVTLWLEAVRPSANLADGLLSACLDPNGGGTFFAMDAVRTTAPTVSVQQIDFKGVNIRIDGGTDIGDPNPNGTQQDIEWVRSLRDKPNSPNRAWKTDQSAPAAFIKGAPLQADVTFSVQPAGVLSQFTIMGSTSPVRAVPTPTATSRRPPSLSTRKGGGRQRSRRKRATPTSTSTPSSSAGSSRRSPRRGVRRSRWSRTATRPNTASTRYTPSRWAR